MNNENLWHRLLVKLKLRHEDPQVTRHAALQARPIRNPKLNWRLDDKGEVAITLPRREGRLWGLVSWIFAVPESRDVTLDEIGTHVWRLCDGEHTVEDLIQELKDEHQLSRREVEVSLTTYLRTLGKRGMVGFLVDDESGAEQTEDKQQSSDAQSSGSAAPGADAAPQGHKDSSQRSKRDSRRRHKKRRK